MLVVHTNKYLVAKAALPPSPRRVFEFEDSLIRFIEVKGWDTKLVEVVVSSGCIVPHVRRKYICLNLNYYTVALSSLG